MKIKITVAMLMIMTMFCINPNGMLTANAGAEKTIAVHANIWTVHGIYSKSATSNSVGAKNYSGCGQYAYCYGQVRSDLSGEWVAYSSSYVLYKDNSYKTMYLSNTIDKEQRISLRLMGASAQVGDDYNRVEFFY